MADKILIVDDTPVNLMLLRANLKRAGYEVIEASNGEDALRAVESSAPDLVLLDVVMPGLSGIDVLRSLRSRYAVTALPVIMATAQSESASVVEALTLGANDYVTKPLDMPVVLARVRTHLAIKHLTAELERKNRFIRRTFGRYLPDDVVTELLASEDALRLGGESRVVTILMSDLRGFTALSERLAPEAVMRMLNGYLGAMADVLARHRGTIDEFIGDAILALFGAPVSAPDDAERAVACAIEMQMAMAGVNAENRRNGLPELEMGIGLHTGEVIVGNIGSLSRAKYGVVGSNVNLTARVESATVGGQVLVSEATRLAAGAGVEVGRRVELRAKGLSEPIAAHELLGLGALRVPSLDEPLVPLALPLTVDVSILEGKEAGTDRLPGTVVSLSTHRCALVLAVPLGPLTNIKLRFRDGDGADVAADVYAKVTAVLDAGGVIAHLTSVPAQARAFLATRRASARHEAPESGRS